MPILCISLQCTEGNVSSNLISCVIDILRILTSIAVEWSCSNLPHLGGVRNNCIFRYNWLFFNNWRNILKIRDSIAFFFVSGHTFNRFYFWLCVGVHMNAVPAEAKRRGQILMGLELQEVVRLPVWVICVNLMPSARAVHALSYVSCLFSPREASWKPTLSLTKNPVRSEKVNRII